MKYFKNRKNVDLYTKMMADYDNSFVINQVNKILPNGSSVLELGMGTGVDLISLSQTYNVVGSDNSIFFIEDFKSKSDIEVTVLDAIDVGINRNFDCIYSNKVLQHLTKKDFIISLVNQFSHLKNNGIIFATLWAGKYKEEFEFDGELRFVYYNELILKEIIPKDLEIEKIISYSEYETNDSLILVIRKK